MTQQYPNPPVVEAIVDFGFQPSRDWNLLVPGQVYDRVKHEYPIQETVYPDYLPRAQELFQTRGFPFVERIRLRATDGTRILQMGRDRLILNQLRPYPGWERLKPDTVGILEHYRQIAVPHALHAISIRYINQINVPDGTPLEGLFAFRPAIEGPLADHLKDFTLSGKFGFERGDALEVQLASIDPAEGSQQSYVLDLDYSAGPEHIPLLDQVGDWLDVAHNRIEQAFEQTIQNSVRQIMNREGVVT